MSRYSCLDSGNQRQHDLPIVAEHVDTTGMPIGEFATARELKGYEILALLLSFQLFDDKGFIGVVTVESTMAGRRRERVSASFELQFVRRSHGGTAQQNRESQGHTSHARDTSSRQ